MRIVLACMLTTAPLVRTMATAFRNPNNLPVKTCVVCQRPFTWRKKWERDWDSITTCSKRCNGARKQQDRQARRRGDLDSSDDESEEEAEVSSMDDASDPKAARKQAKKAAKAARRAVREGRAPEHGQKACDMCSRGVDLLIRCQVSANGQWQLVCGRCWKLPEVAGGVVDGDGSNPHYRYGGLWKNRAAAC